MSNNQVVIDTLNKKREELLAEKEKMTLHFETQIREVENALDQLQGKKVWDNGPVHLYDDENPNYIKSSQEEI